MTGTLEGVDTAVNPTPLAAEDLLTDSPADTWVPDYLPGCQRMTLDLGEDDEGALCATLVRLDDSWRTDSSTARSSQPAPVLYLHGWSDYFYNVESARRWQQAGHRFYALDLRKYGRSLREHHTPGHIEDLEDYHQELRLATEVIAAENPGAAAPIVLGHSTGGLIAALWATHSPQHVTALVLNSPWLEMPGDVPARAAAEGLVSPLSHVSPKGIVRVPRMGSYWESLSNAAQGEWELHPLWRPKGSFSMTLGWLKAVLAGHRQVFKGLGLKMPVLVLLSTESVMRRYWTPEYQEMDGVLNVELLARRAVKLGQCVTVARIPQAMHDVFASRGEVRQHAFEQTQRWLRAYG